jgi:hypothetical protein
MSRFGKFCWMVQRLHKRPRLGLAGILAPVPPMPVHPHLSNLLPSSLAEDGSPSLHPFAGPASTKNTLELSRKPGTGSVDLTRTEGDFRLVVGDFTPVRPNGGTALHRAGERSLDEDGIRCIDRHHQVHVAPGPSSAEAIDQFTPQSPSGSGRFFYRHAFQHTRAATTSRSAAGAGDPMSASRVAGPDLVSTRHS